MQNFMGIKAVEVGDSPGERRGDRVSCKTSGELRQQNLGGNRGSSPPSKVSWIFFQICIIGFRLLYVCYFKFCFDTGVGELFSRTFHQIFPTFGDRIFKHCVQFS